MHRSTVFIVVYTVPGTIIVLVRILVLSFAVCYFVLLRVCGDLVHQLINNRRIVYRVPLCIRVPSMDDFRPGEMNPSVGYAGLKERKGGVGYCMPI